MKKLALVAGLVLAASLAAAPLAFAQDTATKGVPVAVANAACAGVDGQTKPTSFNEAVKVYNTVDNTDDAAFSAIPTEWQKFIIATEDHKDFLGLAGLDNSKTITCAGKVATFPDLAFAGDVATAVCANARLDLIAAPALRARVAAALEALGRTYRKAHSDCAPPVSTTPVTTTPVMPATTTPVTPPPTTTVTAPTARPSADPVGDFDQVGEIPVGAIDTGRA